MMEIFENLHLSDGNKENGDYFEGQSNMEAFNKLRIGELWPMPKTVKKGNECVLVPISHDLQVMEEIPTVSPLLLCGIERFLLLWDKICKEAESDKEQQFDELHKHGYLRKIIIRCESSDEALCLETDESYTLDMKKIAGGKDWEVIIEAKTIYGALYGLTTLSQLPGVRKSSPSSYFKVIEGAPYHIEDVPRFPHRGFMLDTSRHFYSVSSILKTLEGMAASKMNVFHWHLVDSQSFPMKVNGLPRLSGCGAYSREEVYHSEDMVRIVTFAKERGIRVIPELDVPGHSYAWGLGYPHLTVCGGKEDWARYACIPPSGQLNPIKDTTYEAMEIILKETASLFPDSYFHIGGDEVNMNCWLSCPKIQSYLKEKNMKSEDLLTSFMNRIQDMLVSHKKETIAWEDTVIEHRLQMDPSKTILHVWRNPDAVKKLVGEGFKVICSFFEHWYLDVGHAYWFPSDPKWTPPVSTWQKMYMHDPTSLLNDDEKDQVLGGEVCMWSEMVNERNLDALIWPRVAAVAERLYSLNSIASTLNGMTMNRLHVHNERLASLYNIQSGPIRPRYLDLNPDVL